MKHTRIREGIVGNGKRPRASGRAGFLAIALGLALGSPSCSFIVDGNANQCEVNADCIGAKLGSFCSAEKVCVNPTCMADDACSIYAGTRCSMGNTCVSDACMTNEQCSQFANSTCTSGRCTALQFECTKNADCTAKNPHSICRKSDNKCVDVTTAECTTIFPEEADFSNDNAFIIGSILPTTGDYATIGKPPENAIKLAIQEFETNTNGIPAVGGGAPRPYILIGCDDQADDTRAADAARHLSEKLQLPAIIGAAFSGTTIKITSDVTKLAGTLVISPAATSDAITTLDDANLLWRTSPPDALQATALNTYAPTIEQAVKADLMLANIRVMIVNNNDAYGIGLADALQKTLTVNGKAALNQIDVAYKRFQYDFTGTDYNKAVNAVVTFKPHVIYMFGFNEAVTDIFTPIEKNWSDGSFRPRYVFSDGLLVPELPSAIDAQGPLADNLRKRVSGTVPGSQNPLFNIFKIGYGTVFPDPATDGDPSTFGAAGAYDATYLLAYATATLNGMPATGANLAEGLKKMGLKDENPKGSPIEVGTGSKVNQAFTILSNGQTIDFIGASGPLDFDPVSGEAESDIQIWCIPKDMMGKAKSGESSGLFYDALKKQLAGAVGDNCGWTL